MTTTRVLALDLATVTGWAFHESGAAKPVFGTLRLPGAAGDIGRRLDALERFLRDQYKLNRFTHLVMEAQHVAGSKINIDTLMLLIGMAGVADKFAYQAGAHCYRVNIAEWRKHFLGRGASFGEQGAKGLCVDACKALGWVVPDHNAADACGVLDFFLTMLPNHSRPWAHLGVTQPLFGAAR